jgi:desulfoferrodoxin (superoxide reductase-like protein)
LQGTCPLDRKDLMKKKEVPKVEKEEEEDYDEMFA